MTFDFQPAERIAVFESYFFVRLAEKIKTLSDQGMDVIRLDIGSPDLPPSPAIIESLCAAARKADTHGYSSKADSDAFQKAASQYYHRRFNVQLDPQSEVATLIGSKEGLFNLTQAFINPGDIVLVPDPGYPVYAAAAQIAGGIVYPMPLLETNHYLPDYTQIAPEVAQSAKMMWINYPNNPTGAAAPLAFYQQTLEFAQKNGILIASDAPYVDLGFDGYQSPSILQISGAKDWVVEFNSLSKTYNMAGWRLGYACGNAQVIKYLKTYKSQQDSNHFSAILRAGVAALSGDQRWIEERNSIYQKRRDLILKALRLKGVEASSPNASLYVWAKIPDAYASSEQFTNACLEEIGVSFAPGNVYGKYGEGYFRISLGIDTQRLQAALQRFQEWLR